MIRIHQASCNFEREPLVAPFGFKGGYLTELWQTVVYMRSFSGHEGLGLGTQSVLWSDPVVFAEYPESAGNALMFALTAFAAKSIRGLCLSDPLSLLHDLLPSVAEYGRAITCCGDLRLTFVLNALVPIDNAAWQLYAAEHGVSSFDEMIPEEFGSALSYRHSELGLIPLVSYDVSVDEVENMVRDGAFVLKIKIGSDPDSDGDPEKMLAWDISRISSIHQAVGESQTPYTDCGRVLYYLDANARYDSRDRLERLLDVLERIRALDQVIMIEEPFPEGSEIDVGDLPVRIAADESAHSQEDVERLIDLGYSAIALKPAAKTLSETLKMAALAVDRMVPCFCADLTVNPILVDWNKNVAARLAPLPGVKIGLLEMNGDRNYRNWDLMCTYHPQAGASWLKPAGGVFRLDNGFYESSGGILERSEHYKSLVLR